MKKLGFTAVIASGVATAVLGLAAPASAEIGHHNWVHQQHQRAQTPEVDNTVKHTQIRPND